jgi:small subunit ribosomal protein S1
MVTEENEAPVEPPATADPGETQAPAPAEAPAEAEAPSEAPSEAVAPAEEPNTEEPSAEEPSAEAAPGEPAADEPAAQAAPEEAKKKKRRRRKKKKPAEGEKARESEAGAATESARGAAPPSSRGSRPRGKKRPPKLERPAFNVGDEIFGRVSQLTRWAIWVDVAGGKAQGLYDREDLIQIPPKVGEQMIARVKSLSARGGVLMLGRGDWDTGESRTELRAALEANRTVECFVTGVIKGGLEVDYKGIRAFAPASHVELRPGTDLSHLLGEKLPFVVTHYAKKGRDVVVSRKEMIEEAYKKKREEQLVKLQPDMELRAFVRTVLQWGVFVSLPDYDHIEGVIHMSEASHDRSAKLNSVFEVGSEIRVKVLKIDDKGKLWLSHKATLEDPWDRAREKFAVGTRHTGTVVRLTEFGAFVRLEPGLDGLCHVADLSFTPIEHPSEVVKEGEDIEVIIAGIDPKARKVTLHPAPPEDEKDIPRARIAPHQVVQVVVMQIREAGLGVRIVGATGRHARGFIHAGQTGTPRGTDLRKTFPLGKRFDAKVIELDNRRGEARLSIRALNEDAEKQAYREYRKKVQREATFGTFGDLLKGKL